ncbi:MAG: hypothetical protein GY820_03580 [Gammaproteobacteria bacterium]|nr:hypothetical protein [Gammaproteobacteria bacterium]
MKTRKSSFVELRRLSHQSTQSEQYWPRNCPNLAILVEELKFARRQGYGNFDAIMQISLARRGTQFGRPTISIGRALS